MMNGRSLLPVILLGAMLLSMLLAFSSINLPDSKLFAAIGIIAGALAHQELTTENTLKND